jgi:circadian clock protein KaiC
VIHRQAVRPFRSNARCQRAPRLIAGELALATRVFSFRALARWLEGGAKTNRTPWGERAVDVARLTATLRHAGAQTEASLFLRRGSCASQEVRLMDSKRIICTDIPSLDLLLGGGIPRRHSVVVTGEPGTGKTILCSQIAFARAARGEGVVLATVASESQDKLLEDLSGFSFFDPERVSREVFLVSAYPWLQKGPREAKNLLLKTVKDRKAKLLFVDGLRALRDLWQHEGKLREFLYELNVGLAQLEATGLFTTEYPLETLMLHPEATTVDAVIALSARRFGGRVLRRVQVVKLRGRSHLTGEHLMHIRADGISIVPRLEEITQADVDFRPSAERAAFGLIELDRILRGGIPAMSATLMAGSTGVGKTLLASQFITKGAALGEPGLLVSYSEPIGRLIHRAKGVGLDLESMLGTGNLFLEYEASTIEGDDLIANVLEKVRQRSIRRLVIDGLGEIEESVVEKQRLRGVLTSLIIQLRSLGVTTLFIKEVPKIAGPELDFSDTPISVTAENLLFFRHIEFRGSIRRILSVLKMRESGYDPDVREFEITDQGIKVLGSLDSAEGLLTGVARPIGALHQQGAHQRGARPE